MAIKMEGLTIFDVERKNGGAELLAVIGRTEDTGCRKAKILSTEPGSGSKTGSSFRDFSQPEDGCWCPASGDGGIMEREKEKKVLELGEFARIG